MNDFARVERTYRGTKFVFEEADVATYDKCLKKATTIKPDPITGEDEESVDENMLLRLLMRECLVEPKITDFSGLGVRLMRQLERDVRDLHFDVEPLDATVPAKKTTRKKADDVDDKDDDEGNADA